ncbi:MAG: SUF system NifU family Fe-S cluster assembly protein [Gammaproteobacteria bacterium]|nr:SUF system NifU family Fe-S cluster assembly protein [Gammaproteobacteria bacterium]
MHPDSLYKDILLDHYHHPRNKGADLLDDVDIVLRGANPRCGDEVEVGIKIDGGRLTTVAFRGRGCSVCIASASLMTEAARSLTIDEARDICRSILAWFDKADAGEPANLPTELSALAAVHRYPARSRCVMLSWEALAGALDMFSD